MQNNVTRTPVSQPIFRLLSAILLTVFLLSGLAGTPASPVQAKEPSKPRPPGQEAKEELPTNQIIVKFKPGAREFRNNAQAQGLLMRRLSAQGGMALGYVRAMSGDADILQLPGRMPAEQVRAISQRLMQMPDVEYAEPDSIALPTLSPNDTFYGGSQWALHGTYGINAEPAWDITAGSASTVVAVIDTGIRPHAELSGRTVPGYDFIHDYLIANDGTGRDTDPSDPGDWITLADTYGYFVDCYVSDSSWHGTHVAGIIGANANNATGIAGINWNAKILPVRVLGKCGGYTSDIADGIRWAAGLAVSGVPANANPAKVINLSLGGYGACGATYQNAINAVNAAGKIVVVAAGNDGDFANYYQPASCSGVITVAATDISGDQPYYSNYGPLVEISAPGGGDYGNDVFSLSNTGTMGPVADGYVGMHGTSQATPQVSGVISLMLAVNPSLSRAKVLEIIQGTASSFVPYGWCDENPTDCGSGIVNAEAAVKAARFANWVGSVQVTSDRAVVAVGRPHVGAEVASYNGAASGSLTAYIPMLFKDAFGGSYDSALYIQNVDPDPGHTANISIKYYDSAGIQSCLPQNDTVAPLASKGYWLPSVSCLPEGWVGGAVITSNYPIVAVGRPHVGSEVMTYNGFSGGSPVAYLPMLFKNAFGGSYDAAFYVQNVDPDPTHTAHITINYYDSTGSPSCAPQEDSVASLASKGYWVPSVTCVPDGWVGGVVVTSSDYPIVAVARPHIGTQVTTYPGMAGGSTSMYVPMLFKNAYGGSYDAAFYVQNVDPDPTHTAHITINYYDSAGSPSCYVPNVTVASLASKGYWLPGVECLPDGWVGGAVITSSDYPIVAVGRPHIGAQVTTYPGMASGGGSLYLPMLFRNAFGGSYNSAFYIQNTAWWSATVTLKFYDANGVLNCTITDPISPRATRGYWVPSVACDP
jgi:serine protease